MRNNLCTQGFMKNLTPEELAETKIAWKKVDSGCLVEILDELQKDFLPRLYLMNFESGIYHRGLSELEFKPAKHIADYYRLIECKFKLTKHYQCSLGWSAVISSSSFLVQYCANRWLFYTQMIKVTAYTQCRLLIIIQDFSHGNYSAIKMAISLCSILE